MAMRYLFSLMCNCLLVCAVFSPARAQDPQFTQFYAANMYLNPAFTGSTGQGRLMSIYRNQWPGIDANFITYGAALDLSIPKFKSGMGMMVKKDVQQASSDIGLISTDVQFYYSYLIRLNEKYALQAGVNGGVAFKSLDYFNLTFGDQISYDPLTGNVVIDPRTTALPKNQRSYFDPSVGGVFFSEDLWVGLAAHHFNRPQTGFYKLESERLPVKWNFHAGYKIHLVPLHKRDKGKRKGITYNHYLVPMLHYQKQGTNDQLSLGLYFTYNPIMMGVWYRGLPIKTTDVNSGINQDALCFLFGVKTNKLGIGYSYDFPISRLGVQTLGSHEVTLTLFFDMNFKHAQYMDELLPIVDCPQL